MSARRMGWNTRLVHAGEKRPYPAGAIAMPIYQSSTFLQADGDVSYESLKYIRLNNLPNQTVLGAKLAELEGAESGLVCASGMAAVSSAVLGVLRSGDHLLAQDVLYGGTRSFLEHDLPAMGIEVDFVGSAEVPGWEELRRPNTKAVYLESITNPLLQIADLAGIAGFAREHGLISLIDNTIPTPLFYRPVEHGFDVVIHSATKYLNGHTDIVAGAIVGRHELVERALLKLNHFGGSLDPHACMLLRRGMQTLQLRLKHQAASAQALAEFLDAHAAVAAVNYPGLPAHAGHGRAREWMNGFGALLSFDLVGGAEAAMRVVGALELPQFAPSFGGAETLITRPAASSHAGISEEARRRQGIGPGLLRVAVGLEDAEDLIADFRRALDAAGG